MKYVITMADSRAFTIDHATLQNAITASQAALKGETPPFVFIKVIKDDPDVIMEDPVINVLQIVTAIEVK